MRFPRHDAPGGLFGPSFPDVGWVPAPGYTLRRNLLLEQLSRLPKGKLLEIGAATGALVHELSTLGWDCTAVETSPEAFEKAKRVLSGTPVTLCPSLPVESASFDTIIALEVLEHIKEDQTALQQWIALLKPGGRMIISVPAHMRQWSISDEQAGHYRRYERNELETLLQSSGCRMDYSACYGWPLINGLLILRAWLDRRKKKAGSPEECTAKSGIDRQRESRFFPLYTSIFGRILIRQFLLLQRLTLHEERGPGYLVIARKIS